MTSMKKSPASALAALAIVSGLAVSLAAPLPAFAQSTASDEATESQLDMSVEQVFERYGIATEVQSLSLSQLAQIHGIVSSSDGGGTEKQQIEAVVADHGSSAN